MIEQFHQDFFYAHSKPPEYALKKINAGNLKGFSDINPQWRIEALTSIYGLCGVGWYYKVTEKEYRECANGEVMVTAAIELYLWVNGQWSMPIIGNGGNMITESVAVYDGWGENKKKIGSQLKNDDEGLKMAITDALSVACKQIGIASDIYSGKYDKNITERTKYSPKSEIPSRAAKEEKQNSSVGSLAPKTPAEMTPEVLGKIVEEHKKDVTSESTTPTKQDLIDKINNTNHQIHLDNVWKKHQNLIRGYGLVKLMNERSEYFSSQEQMNVRKIIGEALA